MTHPPRRVVVVVFDGLRPDLVRPEITPNILRVAARGTWFRQARGVFPSVTRVSTSSIASGAPPGVHGVVGNSFYMPSVFPDRVLDTSSRADIAAADAMTGNRFVDADTMGDELARAGRSYAVVHAGSGGSAHCVSPRAAPLGQWTYNIHGRAATQTPAAVDEVEAAMGPAPSKELPKLKDQDYAARVLLDVVLPKRPDVALVWFSEPDTSFHYLEIGSSGAMLALRNADAALGTILDEIEARHDAEEVAIVVASDHGQISTSDAIPLFDEANRAGFSVGLGRALGDADFVATRGSSGEVRRRSGDPAGLERLARWLMDHPAVSHVFTKGRNEVEGVVPGTLALATVGQTHARAPDLMYALRSDLRLDRFGLPGVGILMPGDVAVGGGYHGGLNPHELNTVLIVAAPGRVEAGVVSEAAAGIVDIAPTVLALAGVARGATMVGRDLTRPPEGEARAVVHETGHGGFTQRVDCVVEDGRVIIQDGGHRARAL